MIVWRTVVVPFVAVAVAADDEAEDILLIMFLMLLLVGLPRRYHIRTILFVPFESQS